MLKLASDNSAPAHVGQNRRALLAKVHVAAKALGMEDSDYRELLSRMIGVRSARDCSNSQLEAVLREFRRLGYRAPVAQPPQWTNEDAPVVRKVRAMWISLHQLGAIDDPSEAALEKFGKRQLGVDRLQWADEGKMDGLIEALKAMAQRHGWSQYLGYGLSKTARNRALKEGLITALLAKLAALNATPVQPTAIDPTRMTITELDLTARTLARFLSAARKSAQ
jgi:phage gp16-like protein